MIEKFSPMLRDWIEELSKALSLAQAPHLEREVSFLKEESLIFELIDAIKSLPDVPSAEMESHYSALFLAFDICVAQLHGAAEHQNKHAMRLLKQLMDYLAASMREAKHSLGFWLPVLNAFYEAHLELNEVLQQAYLNLVEREEDLMPDETEADHFQSLKEMLLEMSDLSLFDIAEQFFSQSHAMPPDFYIDLIFDLCQIPEGHNVTILFLLHPKVSVRTMVLAILDQMMPYLDLSNASLSYLKTIKRWYPEEDEVYFDRWIKIQRKKGVVFLAPCPTKVIRCSATEIDGAGSQGVFIEIREGKQYRICGLLFKMYQGIKEVWITTALSKQEVAEYTHEAFDDRMSLRAVDSAYIQKIVNHFIFVMQAKKDVPPLRLLEIQSLLGIEFYPERIDLPSVWQDIGVQIQPFTTVIMEAGIQRSKTWFRARPFTQSWFEEEPLIDTYVNRCCNFVKGVKVCALDEACELILHEVLEPKREKWIFHFLWTALWAKSKSRKNERFWQDCFFVAYALYEDKPFIEIPVFRDIANLMVLNSLETMGERRSHLNLSKPI